MEHNETTNINKQKSHTRHTQYGNGTLNRKNNNNNNKSDNDAITRAQVKSKVLGGKKCIKLLCYWESIHIPNRVRYECAYWLTMETTIQPNYMIKMSLFLST